MEVEANDPADEHEPAMAPSAVPFVVPSEVLNPRLLGSVVKLFVTKAEPNYCMPWQVKPQRQSVSSAFVVAGRRLITNAHCVLCETSVRARKRGSAKKFTAKVLTINYQSDLALLAVEDESFWEGLDPLEFEQVPELQDTVVVAGYPTGGDNISVTKGVVSRVDLRDYGHAAYLLTIQIDAAINPGNSGGPAFKKDKVVGIARAHIKNAQNIGYIIPLPVIEHFLLCYEREQAEFQGLCGIGFRFQVTENEALRAKLKMQAHHTGVLVSLVASQGPEAGYLQVGDVIMEVDGVKVADDGTIPFRGTTWSEERISFLHQFNHKFNGDMCRIKVLRSGDEHLIQVTSANITPLVPSMHGFDCRPSYFVVGGLVFVPLTTRFLKDYFGSDWRRRCPERHRSPQP
jgi:S1-C subfamily serine protease